MLGLNLHHLRTLIIRPVLDHIRLYSLAAEQLLVGTALQESRAHYLHQLGKGPAVGIFQMEPATHDDIWRNYLAYHHGLATLVRQLELPQWYDDDAREMAGNLYYAAAMARIHYRRVKAALPAAGDALTMARYWKRWYNTPLGRGTVEEALPHFEAACRQDLPAGAIA